MLRHPGHPCLCLFHARAESQLVETENFGSELAQTISGDFMTAIDIDYAMGRLYTAVAQDRIPIRSANALARIGRIMLGTIPGIKTQFPFSYKFEAGTKCWTPPRASYPRARHSACPPRRRSLPGEATSTIPTPPKPVIPSQERNLSSPLTSVAPLNSRPPNPAKHQRLTLLANSLRVTSMMCLQEENHSRFDAWMCAIFHSPLSRFITSVRRSSTFLSSMWNVTSATSSDSRAAANPCTAQRSDGSFS